MNKLIYRKTLLRHYSTYDARHRLSTRFIPQTKDKSITENTSVSHSILLKAGYVRQSGAGIYSLLPLGLRVINKIENIINEEMEAIGGQKLSLPMLLNPETWKITGRWEGSKGEFFRLKDRKDNDLLLAPTHEEEITQLVAAELRSSKQLPIRLYQIGTKYRDELRPRAGLLRGREFIMKDLYSFDSSQESAYNTYNEVADAYSRIFKRIGVPFVVAEADSGNIGGSKSHEYHLLSDLGEDTLLTCSGCGYTANEELAIGKMNTDRMSEQEIKEGLVSNALSKHIKISQDMNPYVLSYTGLGTGEISVNGYAVLLIPRNRQANLLKVQTKLSKYLKESKELNIQATLDVQPISQKKLDSITAEDIDQLHLFLDDSLPVNNIQSSERVTVHPSDHFRLAEEGDCCAFCETDYKLSSVKSIECGHTFYLGTKYSAALDCGYRDNNKMKKIPAEMGCYGIGVSRLLAAVAEIRHDTKGIAWPTSLAPYRICIVPTDDRKEEFKNASNEVYDELSSCYRNDIVIDDRRSGFGTKMKDTELIGYPYTIVVGQKTLGDDRIVEVHERIQGQPSQKTEISMNQLRDFFK